MKISVEMKEGKDYPESNLDEKVLSLLFADKIMQRLGLRIEDKIKITLLRKKR